ncbi:carboxylate--amine ligase [Aggregicoccus sp. 17bor-14]|uniref:carboxylate--amine ligase n=1 Tax=Myxococcaceae TaxID=31 RepID=UPI00129C68AD|nr:MULTISPECIES: carboxylate--amine ligase [Myxococcaceae]MBF5042262.1 carboxylate--amine ligase [Simulacricoccus sp. 17bor-14]MRI88037.1 carboxylate--amine ligase [Aggregicoccus sp. 17bor-14]
MDLAPAPLDTSVPVVVLSTGYCGMGIARTLGRLGVRMHGVHRSADAPAAHSRYWRERLTWPFDPEREGALAWLIGIGRRIGARPILIPTDDRGSIFVNEHAGALREVFRFPEKPAGLARTLASKKSMYQLCKRLSIPTPETVFPRSRDDVAAYARAARFPVMLKGIDTVLLYERTGTRMVAVQSADELLSLYERMESPEAPNLMLQELIPGGSEQVWMFNGYFDAQSRCLFGLTGKKLRQYPAYAGVTSLGVCVANEAVARQTCELMRAVGYRGILDIGFKFDARTGEYKLLDVNPRVGATFRLFVDSAGMDVVRALYLDLTGQRVLPGRPLEGRKWIVEPYDLSSSVRYLRDGVIGPREWARSFRGLQEGALFAWDDLGPLFAAGGRSLSRGLRRLRAGMAPALPPRRRVQQLTEAHGAAVLQPARPRPSPLPAPAGTGGRRARPSGA